MELGSLSSTSEQDKKLSRSRNGGRCCVGGWKALFSQERHAGTLSVCVVPSGMERGLCL